MSGRRVAYGSSPWWVRQITDDLSIELWPGDSAHVRLVATSYPLKVALTDLEALAKALEEANSALAQATDQTLDHTGPVIDQ